MKKNLSRLVLKMSYFLYIPQTNEHMFHKYFAHCYVGQATKGINAYLEKC